MKLSQLLYLPSSHAPSVINPVLYKKSSTLTGLLYVAISVQNEQRVMGCF